MIYGYKGYKMGQFLGPETDIMGQRYFKPPSLFIFYRPTKDRDII
jgi:hypothetical protein